jgi:hypothetical protein
MVPAARESGLLVGRRHKSEMLAPERDIWAMEWKGVSTCADKAGGEEKRVSEWERRIG